MTAKLILTGLAVLALYIGACWVWPFAACLRCKGDGKFRSPSGKAWRPCRRCKGSGQRVRVGRRLWTAASNTYGKGTR